MKKKKEKPQNKWLSLLIQLILICLSTHLAFAATPLTVPPSGLTATAIQTSSTSVGWTLVGSERYTLWGNEWLEYLLDFGAGGSWIFSLTATNQDSPGLPPGYAFQIRVSVDGVTQGDFLVPGSTTTYQSGSLTPLTLSGVHSIRFTWTNDAYQADVYDANIRVKNVSFISESGGDTTAPTGTISINSGAAYTNTVSATLTLSAADNSGIVSQMQFSDDGITWSSPEAYATTKTWGLPLGDGQKSVFIKYQDIAGNWSSVFSDSIVLDTSPPTAHIVTDEGLTTTSTTNLSVRFSADDPDSGINQYVYALSKTKGGWEIKVGMVSSLINEVNISNLNLEVGQTYYFTVWAQNKAGLWSPGYSDGITVISSDTTPPTNPVVIDDGETTTSLTSLHVRWSSQDPDSGINQYVYALSKTKGGWEIKVGMVSSLINEVNVSNLNLEVGQTYYFTVWAQNKAGLWSPGYSDGITVAALDTTPPTGTLQINQDALYTNTTSVTLTLSAQDEPGGSGLSQMQFSDDGITYSSPEAYATTKAWSLPLGDGQKSVFVRFKDNSGNWSQAYTDTIRLDTTAPVILLNPVSSPTNQEVSLSYTLTDNFTSANEITVIGNNSPYTKEGNYSITLTAKDLAQNTSLAQVSFTIDQTPPEIIIASPPDGAVVEQAQIQLEGTIDSIHFSESRTLIEGENILSKSAADLAGNSASASVTVYLSLGQTIGPEGGEVSSPDGKIKVVIPPGALSSPVPIKIISLNPASFQRVISPETSLLALAECSPFGLVFDKPVQIIYTLSQAEVPGTPVEFALYDSQQDRLLVTGQKAVVPADGYTLSFTITHFLTYGPLKSLISQGAPIGSGVKIPLPDLLTGSFSHGIPITVVPGRKGMQPALSINYRSSNPNSWTGLGFSLNPGYIVRSTRLGPPKYNDTQDTFYFITDAGTTELVHLIDNLYQAKVESSFTKFFKEPDDSWRVVGKDGSVLRFGQVLQSKEASSSGTFSWYLTKAIDTNGNYLTYTYTQGQGKTYLSRIDYTGNEAGILPTNSLEFTLEPREDVLSSYISTAKISTVKRLKEILVKQNSELVWRYVLEYDYSPDTHRSLLRSVTQYGADGKALPTQTFSYQIVGSP